MGWKILRLPTFDATKQREQQSLRPYRALVDGILMGKVVEFGITNRCNTCKGTGLHRARKGARACGRCKGLGYIEPSDTCMHLCGCDKTVDPQLVFICTDCFNDLCYAPGAFDIA